MKATGDLPREEFPEFRQQGSSPYGDLVDVGRWRRLEPPSEAFPPTPWKGLGPDPDKVTETTVHGAARMGRRRLSVSYPRTASEVDALFPDLEISDREPEIATFVPSDRWTAQQFPQAYRHALRIMRRTGFAAGAAGFWIFKEQARRWWVLPDWHGDLMGPRGDWSHDACWFVPARHLSPDAFPFEFYDQMGGADGPLEWAVTVITAVQNLRRSRDTLRERMAGLAVVLDLPEWAMFAEAVKRRGEPKLDATVHQIRHIASGGASSVVRTAFSSGYDVGDALAVISVASAVRTSEAARNPGKTALRAFLRRIALDEAERGPLQPYTLANVLIAERDADTPRARRLMELGMAADPSRVGRLIAEEADKAAFHGRNDRRSLPSSVVTSDDYSTASHRQLPSEPGLDRSDRETQTDDHRTSHGS